MSEATLLKILLSLWAAFGLYWVGSAARSANRPRSERISSESGWYRPLRLAILVFIFVLMFSRSLARGFLGERFIPPTVLVPLAGFILALSGLLLALWARIHLGQYWSDRVQLKAGHQLVSTGPYRVLRHPIYSGVLAGVLGTALVLGEWRGLLAFALMLVNYSIKARREERILAAQFGEAFRDHRERTGFLLPQLFSRGQRAKR